MAPQTPPAADADRQKVDATLQAFFARIDRSMDAAGETQPFAEQWAQMKKDMSAKAHGHEKEFLAHAQAARHEAESHMRDKDKDGQSIGQVLRALTQGLSRDEEKTETALLAAMRQGRNARDISEQEGNVIAMIPHLIRQEAGIQAAKQDKALAGEAQAMRQKLAVEAAAFQDADIKAGNAKPGEPEMARLEGDRRKAEMELWKKMDESLKDHPESERHAMFEKLIDTLKQEQKAQSQGKQTSEASKDTDSIAAVRQMIADTSQQDPGSIPHKAGQPGKCSARSAA